MPRQIHLHDDTMLALCLAVARPQDMVQALEGCHCSVPYVVVDNVPQIPAQWEWWYGPLHQGLRWGEADC